MIVRNDNDPSRMLSGRSLDTGAPFDKIIYVVFVRFYIVVFDVVFDVSVGCFVRDRRNSSRLENVLLTEYLSDIPVSHRLVFSGEVKVYIRLLVPLESEECSERDIETFLFHAGAAFRAHLFRHIVARVIFVRLTRPFKMFAFRTYIVRSQRIYFCYAGHRSSKRRSDGSS